MLHRTLLALTVVFSCASAWAAPSIVDVANIYNSNACGEAIGASSIQAGTVNAAVAVGDYLIVIATVGNNDSGISATVATTYPSGGLTGTWGHALISSVWLAGVGRVYAWKAKVTTAVTNGIGVTVSATKAGVPASTFIGVCVFEVAGMTGADWAVVVASTTPSLSVNTPTITTRHAQELLIGLAAIDSTPGSPESDSPFIDLAVNGFGGNPLGYANVTSTGSYAATLYQAVAGHAVAAILSFY